MLDKIANFLTGGIADKAIDAITQYFPPDMTEEQKANVNLALKRLELEQTIEANKALSESEKAVNERVAQLEGTASDLKSLPIVGNVIIFARGSLRPFIGYATVYIDYLWFTGALGQLTEQQESCLWLINMLVLSFNFGERSLQNLSPLIERIVSRK